MTTPKLIEQLSYLAENHLDDLYELSIAASKGHDSITAQLKEEYEKLQLAINQELMDEYQTKLAYRVTIQNLVKQYLKDLE